MYEGHGKTLFFGQKTVSESERINENRIHFIQPDEVSEMCFSTISWVG